jgi:hypothetical protein
VANLAAVESVCAEEISFELKRDEISRSPRAITKVSTLTLCEAIAQTLTSCVSKQRQHWIAPWKEVMLIEGGQLWRRPFEVEK